MAKPGRFQCLGYLRRGVFVSVPEDTFFTLQTSLLVGNFGCVKSFSPAGREDQIAPREGVAFDPDIGQDGINFPVAVVV